MASAPCRLSGKSRPPRMRGHEGSMFRRRAAGLHDLNHPQQIEPQQRRRIEPQAGKHGALAQAFNYL